MAREAGVYHHGNLQRALLDAALALFADRGRFDFTMRELARAAGVTHNAPYRHFADRWALLDALAAGGVVILRDRCLAAGADEGDPRTRVRKLGEAYVGFAAEHPNHFRLMFLRPIEDASPELAHAARASYAVLEETIASADGQGLLRPGLAARDATLAAWALVHGIASLVVGGQLGGLSRGLKTRIDGITSVFAEGAFGAPAANADPGMPRGRILATRRRRRTG